MKVEDVARVGLAARRAAQQQGQLAVRLGLLGQVVVHDQGVLAVLHPVLAHGAAGVGRQVLERGGIGGWRRHHHRVLHGPVLPEGLHGVGHRRALLPDGHVDALHALALLVQDRVHGHRGLAGLAVADDQLALAPADGDHGVDGLDPGLQRLVHGLAAHDARRLDLHPAVDTADDGPLAVDRLAEGVDHAAQHGVADKDGQDAAGRPDRLSLLDALGLTQDDGADRRLLQVQGQARRCRPRTRAAR